MVRRAVIDECSRPRFAPHVRLHYNDRWGQWIVLAPERLLVPDEQAVKILRLLDGDANVGHIASAVAAEYGARREVVRGDVIALLQDLADKGFVET